MRSEGPNQSTIPLPRVANTLDTNNMYVGYVSFMGSQNPPYLGTESGKGHTFDWYNGVPILDTILLIGCHFLTFKSAYILAI